jgi:hypothetical protein
MDPPQPTLAEIKIVCPPLVTKSEVEEQAAKKRKIAIEAANTERIRKHEHRQHGIDLFMKDAQAQYKHAWVASLEKDPPSSEFLVYVTLPQNVYFEDIQTAMRVLEEALAKNGHVIGARSVDASGREIILAIKPLDKPDSS